MSVERDFKGIWIPVELWEDRDLSPFEVVLLSEIDSLDRGEGCWMTGENLAKRMRCSLSHLENTLTDLRKRKYIITISRTREKRYLRTRFSRHLVNQRPTEKSSSDLLKKVVSSSYYTSYNTQKRVQRDCGADAPQCSFSFGVNGESNSPECKLATEFHEFAIKNRLLVGRDEPDLKTWKRSLTKLFEQIDAQPPRVEKVMRWYFKHFRDKYVPKCYAVTTFCDKFLSVEDAMHRVEAPEDDVSTVGHFEDTIVETSEGGRKKYEIKQVWITGADGHVPKRKKVKPGEDVDSWDAL